jgi:hypothetical protein
VSWKLRESISCCFSVQNIRVVSRSSGDEDEELGFNLGSGLLLSMASRTIYPIISPARLVALETESHENRCSSSTHVKRTCEAIQL